MQTMDKRAYIDQALLMAAASGVLLVLIMPLVISTDTLYPFIVGKALYSRIFIEITFAVWLVLAVRNPSYRPVLSRLMIAFTVYVAISLLAGFTGVSLQRSLWSTYERMQGVIDLAHWFAFTVVLTSLFRTPGDWRLVLNFSLLISAAMALMGVALIIGGELPFYGLPETGPRIVLTLGNATYVGAYTLINALIGAGLLAHSFTSRTTGEQETPAAPRNRRRRRREGGSWGSVWSNLLWWRLFWAATVSLNLWMMLESGTRVSLVALAAALAAMAAGYLLWGRLKPVKVAAAVMIAGIAAVSLFLVLGAGTPLAQQLAERNQIMNRLVNALQGNDASLQGRLTSVDFGLQGFADKPVLGWGPENYFAAWGRHYDAEKVGDSPEYLFDQAHSKPVEELTTKGIAGLSSYLSLWILMLWMVSARLRRSGADSEILVLVMGAAMVAYFTHNLALFDTPATFMQFVVLLGFAASLDTTRDGLAERGRRIRLMAGAVADGIRIRQLASRACRAPAVGWLGVAALAVILGMMIHLGNVRIYQAAVEGNRALAQRVPDWPARLYHFDRAISLFPPLANGPRQDMLGSALSDWNALLQFQGAAGTMHLVDRTAEEILDSEPQLWYAYVSLAQVYQNASSLDPSYAAVARAYVERAEGLAPETPGVVAVKARQERIEQALESSSAR